MKSKNILSFWRNVEIFDLPDFKKEAVLLKNDDTLPWLNERKLTSKENYIWQYTLIFGRIEKKNVIDYIDKLLGTENKRQDWEEPVRGFTCLSALVLDEDGRPDQRSYIPASFSFGIQALEQNENLSSISTKLTKAQEDFELRYNILPQAIEDESLRKGEIITPIHLKAEMNYLTNITANWDCQPSLDIFLYAKEVHKNSKSDPIFLNSFFLGDLNYLSDLATSRYSKTLKEYLNLQVDEENRKDIIAEKQYLFDTINPKVMTAGRWPSSINHGLYTAQLGAVNTIFSEIGNSSGIQGINGPPGTGKTTLLLDVIAEIIVKRAQVLSEIGYSRIFEKGYDKIEKENGFTLYSYNINNKLLNDFGIIVASNNNSAVENITKELPAKKKIDAKTFSEANYFSECSGNLINEESWGILAASLGNAENRTNFRNAFWENDKKNNIIGFNKFLSAIYQDQKNDQTSHYQDLFNSTRDKLQRLLKKFEVFKEVAGSFHSLLPSFKNDKERINMLKSKAAEIESLLIDLHKAQTNLSAQEKESRESMGHIQTAINFLTMNKPSFFIFQKIFNSKPYRQWKLQADNYLNDYNIQLSKNNTLKLDLSKINDQIAFEAKQKDNITNEIAILQQSIDLYLHKKKQLQKEYEIDSKQIYDEDFEKLSLDEIHIRMPYYSTIIAKLRSDIFLLSLSLHKYAILSNAKKFRGNLNTFFEMIGGQATIEPYISENLWSTFFLCIPVVSTTLASASRLFPNLYPNQLGWLLIDEAGQATPQSIVGSIYRSKRSIIIGDPLQVEPVVTIPAGLVFKLRQQEQVDTIWSPTQTSAQQLVDRISTRGTYMQNGFSDDLIWTGFPLRTHRRCNDPMFTIANKIAYGEQMVKDTIDEPLEFDIGISQWFDIVDEKPPINKHALKGEIEELKTKIIQLQNKGYNGNIYVISPFKSVADQCAREFYRNQNISCGTIHKFQGKEADIVFLVLGSDPKSSGARNWASSKPNMLNVALTRAKKRIYVIGNKNLWRQCSYFNVMAATI